MAVRAIHVHGERIFVAAGAEVAGYNKKGKRFYNITTLMTEPITQTCVARDFFQPPITVMRRFLDETELHVCGSLAYSCYADNSEMYHVVMPDAILDMLGVLLPTELGGLDAPPNSKLHTVLACADRTIHVLKGAKTAYTVPVSITPTTLCVLDPTPGQFVSCQFHPAC